MFGGAAGGTFVCRRGHGGNAGSRVRKELKFIRLGMTRNAKHVHAVIDVVGLAFNTKYIVERPIFYFILKC